MNTLYYENNSGQRIYLWESPFYLQTDNIFDFEWLYEHENSGCDGGVITKFYRNLTEIDADMIVKTITKEDFAAAMNRFLEVTESDLLNLTPGKLVTDGDQYMRCYMISRAKKRWNQGINTSVESLKIIVEKPVWKKDYIYDFTDYKGYESKESMFLDYPYDYPYDYRSEFVGQLVDSNHIALGGSNLKIIIGGPVENPYVEIGPNKYEVMTTLGAGEHLVLDTESKTIWGYKNGGEKVNLMNARSAKQRGEFFAKLPKGKHLVVTNTRIEVTVYEERSEPLWSFS